MLAAGLLDEVRALADRPAVSPAPPRQALGYKELLAHLDGQSSLDEATALAVTRTRRSPCASYAGSSRDPRIRWVEWTTTMDAPSTCWWTRSSR